MYPPIYPEGTTVFCPKCAHEIGVVIKDIYFATQYRTEYFQATDGLTVFKEGFPAVSGCCGVSFLSIGPVTRLNMWSRPQ